MAYTVIVEIDAQGNVSCDPGELKIKPSLGTVTIRWRIRPRNGWEITGISDPDGNPLDTTQFKASAKSGETGWKIQDRNTSIQDYEYVVHVQQVKTGECKAHDPIIRNGGRR